MIWAIIATNKIFSSSISNENKRVEIYYQGKLLEDKIIYFSDLKENEVKEIILSQEQYDKLLGDFSVIIDAKKGVKVDNVTCPNHYCENQGYINSVGMPIVCVPNGVYVIITKTGDDNEIVI